MWTKKSYDLLFEWINPTRKAEVRAALLADDLTEEVARLEAATNFGIWYKMTKEAAEAVGPEIVEQVAQKAGLELDELSEL